MKMTLGYIFTFLCMTGFVAFAIMAVVTFFLVLIFFVSWSLPAIVLADVMLFLRIIIAAGSIVGAMFVFSKEGKELAEDFAILFSEEGSDIAKDFETMFSGESKNE